MPRDQHLAYVMITHVQHSLTLLIGNFPWKTRCLLAKSERKGWSYGVLAKMEGRGGHSVTSITGVESLGINSLRVSLT